MELKARERRWKLLRSGSVSRFSGGIRVGKRGARARSTKQKARLERYEEMKNQHGPQSDGQVSMSSITTRMGNTTIEIDGISKSYGGHTFIRDFSYIFLKNDRVGFVGTNGCGKTTLMKLLAGREEPDSGSIKVGQNDQDRILFPGDRDEQRSRYRLYGSEDESH